MSVAERERDEYHAIQSEVFAVVDQNRRWSKMAHEKSMAKLHDFSN